MTYRNTKPAERTIKRQPCIKLRNTMTKVTPAEMSILQDRKTYWWQLKKTVETQLWRHRQRVDICRLPNELVELRLDLCTTGSWRRDYIKEHVQRIKYWNLSQKTTVPNQGTSLNTKSFWFIQQGQLLRQDNCLFKWPATCPSNKVWHTCQVCSCLFCSVLSKNCLWSDLNVPVCVRQEVTGVVVSLPKLSALNHSRVSNHIKKTM